MRIHGLRIDHSRFRKRAINHSLMTGKLILSTRGSQKIHNTIGTPPCTFRQPWYSDFYFSLFNEGSIFQTFIHMFFRCKIKVSKCLWTEIPNPGGSSWAVVLTRDCLSLLCNASTFLWFPKVGGGPGFPLSLSGHDSAQSTLSDALTETGNGKNFTEGSVTFFFTSQRVAYHLSDGVAVTVTVAVTVKVTATVPVTEFPPPRSRWWCADNNFRARLTGENSATR